MDLLSNLGLGFATAASPENLLFCLIGVILGTLIGVLPGIGATVLTADAPARILEVTTGGTAVRELTVSGVTLDSARGLTLAPGTTGSDIRAYVEAENAYFAEHFETQHAELVETTRLLLHGGLEAVIRDEGVQTR